MHIGCELRNLSLEHNPVYEALSYVWGSPTETRCIELGGCEKNVTVNLKTALRHIRDAGKPRVLWVDALCINQEDLKEREEQVKIMYRIFSQASHVIAWAGEASQDSDEAIDLMKRFGHFFDTVDWTSDQGPGILSQRLTRLGFPMETQNWTSLWNFFDRPYWSRLWVVQELASRGCMGTVKPCTIQCGHAKLQKEWHDSAAMGLLVLFSRTTTVNLEKRDLDEPFRSLFLEDRRFPPIGLVMFQTLLSWSGVLGPGISGLKRLFSITSPLYVTDERDKIYALLGLAPKTEQAVSPDYGKPTWRVLMDYTKFFINHERKLDVLWSNRKEMCSTAPSWAPEIHWEHQAEEMWTSGAFAGHLRASGHMEASVEFVDSDGLMRARGILIDVITNVIGPLIDGNRIPGGAADMSERVVKTGQSKVLDELFAYARSLNDVQYEVFWRTLILDRDRLDLASTVTSSAPPESEIRSRVFFNLRLVPTEFDPDIQGWGRHVAYTEPYSSPMSTTMLNRTFFRTEKEYMGMGPYSTQAGDVVVILYGSDRCIVLRPGDAGYCFVGDAYLQGFMNGELVGQKMQETDFDIY